MDESKELLEEVLRGKLGGRAKRDRSRRWERSRERLVPHGMQGVEGLYDSDGSYEEDLGEGTSDGRGRLGGEDEVWTAGEGEDGGRRRARAEEDGSKQWGVKKMELMSTVWGKKGLTSIYVG